MSIIPGMIGQHPQGQRPDAVPGDRRNKPPVVVLTSTPRPFWERWGRGTADLAETPNAPTRSVWPWIIAGGAAAFLYLKGR